MTAIQYTVKRLKLVFVITREKKLSCQYILNNLIVKVNGYYAVKNMQKCKMHTALILPYEDTKIV